MALMRVAGHFRLQLLDDSLSMPFSTDIRNRSQHQSQPVITDFYVSQYDINGALRVLWWPPKHAVATEITSILVFTCGNPGIPEWYIEFLTLIKDECPGVAIAACGHLGHANDIPNPSSSSSLSLNAQVDAHGAVLEGLHELFPNARFVSLSHSIGGFISLNVARLFPDWVTSLILLQPTISNMGYTPNGRTLKYFFLEPVRTVLSLLGAFLVAVFPFILSLLFKSWPRDALGHLKNFLASSSTSHASMTMASDEMVSVAELDKGLLLELREKLHILYSESGDMWVGTNGDEVVQVLGAPSRIRFAPVPHAFCIHHSAETAEACLPWIKRAFKEHSTA